MLDSICCSLFGSCTTSQATPPVVEAIADASTAAAVASTTWIRLNRGLLGCSVTGLWLQDQSAEQWLTPLSAQCFLAAATGREC